MTRFLPFLFLLAFCEEGLAQQFTTAKTAAGKLKTTYDRGLRMFDLQQLGDAAADFEKAVQLDPTFIDAHIQLANVRNMQGQYPAAELGYERAIGIDSMYEPNVFYSLAIVEFDQKKFGEAAEHMQLFLAKAPKISPSRKLKAEQYLRNASFSAQALANPVPFNPVNLGPGVNTEGSEYLPTLTADGESLIFTAYRGGQEDFYQSKKGPDGTWQTAQPMTAVNTPNNEGAQSVSADGKLLVFTACHRQGGLGGCDLYISELKNGKWTPVRNLGAPVNTSGWESQPSISADGQILFFVSERKGGLGGKDIWVSQRQPDGKWGSPENLGEPLNTAGDEQSPFIHADGQTLYFMSNGHPGMGGFDLFLSRRHGPCGTPCPKWQVPQNLGYPINTEGNEGALSVSIDGKTAYFATDVLKVRDGASASGSPQSGATTDIYSFELPEKDRAGQVTFVKASVKDATTGQPIAARVEIIELAKKDATLPVPSLGTIYTTIDTEADGEFLVTLPAGGNYALSVSKDKYLFYSDNFELTAPGTVDKPFRLDIALVPVGASEASKSTGSSPIVLKNIFFETGSAELKQESLLEVARLKKLLDDNPSLKIQINGHTDNVGSDADNLRLSENRAKAVYEKLLFFKADPNRLKFKGFGEAKPAATNDTEEGRRQNRRTEYEVVQ